jgi:hypothetical protein
LPSGLRLSDAEPAAADGDEPLAEGPAVRRVASAAERLRGRDFAQLSPAELRQLVVLIREMTLASRRGAPAGAAPPATASGLTCAGRYAWPGAAAARRSGSPAGRRGSGRAA